jgi:hypothetical protein
MCHHNLYTQSQNSNNIDSQYARKTLQPTLVCVDHSQPPLRHEHHTSFSPSFDPLTINATICDVEERMKASLSAFCIKSTFQPGCDGYH